MILYLAKQSRFYFILFLAVGLRRVPINCVGLFFLLIYLHFYFIPAVFSVRVT